jgi:xanthine dehydrogenase YagT iron-sulfur-binding subunit
MLRAMSKRSSITRRGLFRGIGTATLVAGCAHRRDSHEPRTRGAGDLDAEEIGPKDAPLRFTLNGKAVETTAEPRTTLLSLLRNRLDTTGPKEACDRGSCGACTVLIDGVPKNACMTLAHDVEGAEVVTVEGLADGDKLSTLQESFIEHDALQCGFCTSGMLTSSTALLERKGSSARKLTAHEIEEALAGNLCRCGSYTRVVQAVLATAKRGGA